MRSRLRARASVCVCVCARARPRSCASLPFLSSKFVFVLLQRQFFLKSVISGAEFLPRQMPLSYGRRAHVWMTFVHYMFSPLPLPSPASSHYPPTHPSPATHEGGCQCRHLVGVCLCWQSIKIDNSFFVSHATQPRHVDYATALKRKQ